MKLLGTMQRILWGDDVVRVPTALDRMIWLCAAACPSFLAAACFFKADRPLVYTLVALAAVPLSIAQATLIYLILYDPDRLQAAAFKSAPNSRK